MVRSEWHFFLIPKGFYKKQNIKNLSTLGLMVRTAPGCGCRLGCDWQPYSHGSHLGCHRGLLSVQACHVLPGRFFYRAWAPISRSRYWSVRYLEVDEGSRAVTKIGKSWLVGHLESLGVTPVTWPLKRVRMDKSCPVGQPYLRYKKRSAFCLSSLFCWPWRNHRASNPF